MNSKDNCFDVDNDYIEIDSSSEDSEGVPMNQEEVEEIFNWYENEDQNNKNRLRVDLSIELNQLYDRKNQLKREIKSRRRELRELDQKTIMLNALIDKTYEN